MLPEQLNQLKKFIRVLMRPSPHLADEVIAETLARLQGGPHRMANFYNVAIQAGLDVVARYR